MFSFPIYEEAVITDSITTFWKLPRIHGYPNTCSLQVSIYMLSCRTVGRTGVNHPGTPETQAIHWHPKEEMPHIFATLSFCLASSPGKDISYQQTQTSLQILFALFVAASSTTKKKQGTFTKYEPNERETCNNAQHHWVVLAAFGCEAELRREQSPQRGRPQPPAFPIPYNRHGFYRTHNLLRPAAGRKGCGCPAGVLLPSP